MSWNSPGGNSNDPWGSNRPNDGPPDLDEFLRKLQKQLGGLLGKKGGGNSGGSDGAGLLAGLLGIVALGLVAYGSCYIVAPAERGVVTRFGEYVTTLENGFHLRLPPPIETVTRVNVDAVRTVKHQALMLTEDENIVDIELDVQYRVKDIRALLFEVRDPERTLQQSTETSVREVIGNSKLDSILTEGRAQIVFETKEQIQDLLDNYDAGLLITSVNMQPAKPPEQVKAAFEDVIKAREDRERFINEAEAYRNEILPQARGEAARQIADATAYREQLINQSKGESERFRQLLTEYEKAPEITRQRLYLETVEEVMGNSSKVLIDGGAANSLMYLPLDQLMKRRSADAPRPTTDFSSVLRNGVSSAPTRSSRDGLTRGAR